MNSKPLEFVVTAQEQGKRIDRFLSENINRITRSQISILMEQGKVRVNQQSVTKSYRIKEGDRIYVLDLVKDDSPKLEPENLNLNILYEDKYLMVVSKPAGMVCHPGPGHSRHTLVNALLYHSQKLSDRGEGDRPGIVHRLDKDTSGLVVVAKDNHTHQLLSDLFKSRQVKKIYWALVWGNFSEKKGMISLPLSRSAKDRKKIAVSSDRGRQASTEFEIREQFNQCSWLSINLKTGRTHQIRVHMNYIDHPVIGDNTYRNKESAGLAQTLGLSRQFLHAIKIEFVHPIKKTGIKVEDSLPAELQSVLDRLILNKQ
ncbi:MAG: RluA family pseudouridine synthase [Actinomycetia bacterium]|nr:RluA family pseudouridine synthase [Actinomycetes bacterium]